MWEPIRRPRPGPAHGRRSEGSGVGKAERRGIRVIPVDPVCAVLNPVSLLDARSASERNPATAENRVPADVTVLLDAPDRRPLASRSERR
jgi:hypothetical protein